MTADLDQQSQSRSIKKKKKKKKVAEEDIFFEGGDDDDFFAIENAPSTLSKGKKKKKKKLGPSTTFVTSGATLSGLPMIVSRRPAAAIMEEVLPTEEN